MRDNKYHQIKGSLQEHYLFLHAAEESVKTTVKLHKDEVDCFEAVNGNQLDRFLLIAAAWNDQPQQQAH